MGKQYEVEAILAKKVEDGETYYEVKWKGYGSEDNTWEPEENVVQCKQLMREFENSLKSKDQDPKESDDNETQNHDIKTQPNSVTKKIKKNNGKDKNNKKSTAKKEDKLQGSLENGDKIEKIIRCSQKSQKLVFEVKWQKRDDGTVLANSVIGNEACRKEAPQELIDYYQARITFKHHQK